MKKEAGDVLIEISPYEAPRDHLSPEEYRFEPGGVTIGLLKEIGDSGEPRVDYRANPASKPQSALTAVKLCSADIGKQVILSFEDGDLSKPIVIGLIQSPQDPAASAVSEQKPQQQSVDLDIDGERIVITGRKEVVLRCGKASITLTRAGKVILRGAYLLSRASGVNRIKGGSVQLN